jgi:hypothetical protein
MGVAAGSLITLAQFKAYLPDYSGGTKYDTLFETLIDGVTEAFNAYVGRALAKTTYAAVYFDGNGKESLLLPNYPIASVTSITEDGNALTEGEDSDYLLYAATGILKRVNGAWYKGSKTIKITYVAGYVVQGATVTAPDVALPADLKMACMVQVAREWKKATLSEWGAISKSSPDGMSVTRTETGLLKEVREILDRYRSYIL